MLVAVSSSVIAAPVGGLVSEKPTGAIGCRVEPGVHPLTRAPLEDGVLLSRVEGGQHPSGSSAKEATWEEEDRCHDGGPQSQGMGGCCGFSHERSLDLHLDELSYASRNGDSNCLSSAAESNNGWMELEVTVDSGTCDTVMPISSCDFKILPSYASRNDMEYA